MGDGPIDAAYNAIDKIVKVSGHKLENYSIHSVGDGRDALGEVVVRVKYGDKVFVGRGLSTDILESSLLAYINGINKIMEGGVKKVKKSDLKQVSILDSTLRDRCPKARGISFSVQDKINIVQALDEFGVEYIEAGNPFSNPKDLEFFEKPRSLN